MKQIILSGFIGSDAEIKITQDDYIMSFNVAVSEKFNNSNGETVEKTDWFTIFQKTKTAPKIVDFLLKGTKVTIIGDINFSENIKDGKTYFNKIVYPNKIDIHFDKKVQS